MIRYVPTEASQSTLKQFDPASSGREWTLEQALNPQDGFGRARTFVGGPARVADALEQWLDASGTDGINLVQLVHPDSYADFIRLVVPELRRRGRLRDSDSDSDSAGAAGAGGDTLRARVFPHLASGRPDRSHPSARYAF